MTPKLIKTESEYENALAQVDALMSARPNSPETEQLELWVHLVETYEDNHYPISMPDPISAIRFRMEQPEMRPAELIPYIGSKSKVSEILNGKRQLSLNMIQKLHKGLGIPADVLLSPPVKSVSRSTDCIHWADFPLAEMVKRRWFGDEIKSSRELRDRAEEILSPYFAPILPVSVHLRQRVDDQHSFDENALLAWESRAWHLAEKQIVDHYIPENINQQFITDVARLSMLDTGPLLAKEMLAKSGIHMVIEPNMPHTRLDGAAMRLEGNPPILALTLRYDRLDYFWFTLCHELAHIALHLKRDVSMHFLDEEDANGDDQRELDADRLASEAMIPESVWLKLGKNHIPSKKDIMAFASKLRIHPAIVAGRYRKESGNFKIYTDLIGNRMVKRLFET